MSVYEMKSEAVPLPTTERLLVLARFIDSQVAVKKPHDGVFLSATEGGEVLAVLNEWLRFKLAEPLVRILSEELAHFSDPSVEARMRPPAPRPPDPDEVDT